MPDEFKKYNFHPDKLSINSTGTYLLDVDNRQISFIGNDKKIIFSGGYGNSNDAFIDPIDILSSKLKVWVVDGTENKVTSFDYRLNYMNIIDFEDIYPNLCAIDDWDNLLLYSQLYNKIYKINSNSSEIYDFIDLSIYNNNENSIIDLRVAPDGNIGLLSKNFLFIFNRLGKLTSTIPTNHEYAFVFKNKNHWFAIDQSNFIIDLMTGDKTNLPSDKAILDIFQKDDLVYLLLSDQIRVVNVALE